MTGAPGSLDAAGLPPYAYAGARALVRLHEQHLSAFLAAWRRARAAGIELPRTPEPDPDYASLEALLAHVLRSARGYMVWMCTVLDLPDPAIAPAPPAESVAAEADAYVDHLTERWRTPLAGVPEGRFGEEHESRWKVRYCIDAMLEHAVMHPIRHRFQLEELLARAEAR
jgi:uncharacterized damage-inducible protein DinB